MCGIYSEDRRNDSVSLPVVGLYLVRHHERYCRFVEWVMVRVNQGEEQLVGSRCEALQNDRIAAGIRPHPRRVVKIHMDVSEAG